MIEIDGSTYSGSGTIVRQAVVFAGLTGQPVHIKNARIKRRNPGLRPQHIRVVKAVSELVGGTAEGLEKGSMEFRFWPKALKVGMRYRWSIGSAGSTTMLALAVLPLLAYAQSDVRVELEGGLFQDFAPSVFHLQYVVLPILKRMGLEAKLEMVRPGYVPQGGGTVVLHVSQRRSSLRGLVMVNRGPIERVWGIALASHLQERHVSERMAKAASKQFASAGYQAEIQVRDDTTAPQPGAVLAAFMDCSGGVRLGADRAGAIGRPAEAIGKYVARQLLEEYKAEATVDRFTADQVIPLAALATGESRFTLPHVTDHVKTTAWLAKMFLGAEVRIEDRECSIKGIGFGEETALRTVGNGRK